MIAIFNFPKLIEQQGEQISDINHVCCHNEDLFFLRNHVYTRMVAHSKPPGKFAIEGLSTETSKKY